MPHLVAAGQAKGHKGSNDAKDFDGQQGMNFARVRVGPHQLKDFAPGDNKLLEFGSGKISMNRMCYACGTLKGEIVQMHDGSLFVAEASF